MRIRYAIAPVCVWALLSLGACSDDNAVHGNNNNNNNNNTNQADCGNNMVEAGEECDDGVLNSDVAPDACRTTCVEPFCGDGVADSVEACDGTDLGGQTCASVGSFDHGDLGCTGECQLDVSACTECGNGVVEGDEECDEGAGNCDDGPGCTCATSCTAPGCGNGVVEPYLGEECDEGAANCDGPQCTCSTSCAGFTDACGFPTDGIWLEVDYTNAASVLAPQWTFSETPGWGEAEWATDFFPLPWIDDANDTIVLVDDAIGRLAHVSGVMARLQIMYGLQGLLSYSYASICVEGRSMVPGLPSNINVFNILNGCGLTTSIDPDPQVHAVGVDLSNCAVVGNNYQGITIQPSDDGDEIGVLRVRFTLHGAVY